MDINTIAETLAYVVTIASTITATTNTPNDNGVLGKVYKIIEFFALVNDKVKQK